MSKRQQSLKKYMRSKNLTPVNNRKRVGGILFVVAVSVFLLFSVRLSYIILAGKVNNVSLKEKTQELYQGSSVVKAKRGSILDRNGNPIAEDATSYSLYAILDKKYLGLNKKELFVHEKDHQRIAEILKQYAGIDPNVTLKQLQPKKNDQGKWITTVEFGLKGKGLSLETKKSIEAALDKENITGIYFQAHPARSYPNGNFATYLIGYTQYVDAADDTKGLKGVLGIEEAYNKQLNGQDGKIVYEKDSKGNEIPGSRKVVKQAKDGEDIYTTLDSNLQFYLDDCMTQVGKKYTPENMTAMLVEAKTGDIVAASQYPSFNPETKEGIDKNTIWQNLLYQAQFEPGSTMKVFTVSAAIENGVFNPNATFMSGHVQVDDTPINDWDPAGRGLMTYRQALAWSSNSGMVHLEQMMPTGWQTYLQKFGFGQSTHSGLLNELSGGFQNGTTVDRAMTAYGQAINVTDFQMMQGFTAIANDGKMMKLRYIEKTIDSNGKIKNVEPKVVSQPIKSSTAHQVLDMMQDVVKDKDYGTGYGIFNIDGYNVSAKTGTAQIFENGAYGNSDYINSVVQIAPSENPKYIMYVTIKRPKLPDGTSASQVVAKISNPVLKRALDLGTSDE